MIESRRNPPTETRKKTETPPLLPRKPRQQGRRIFPWRRFLRFTFAASIIVGSLAITAIAAINFSVKTVLPRFLASRTGAEVRINGIGFNFRRAAISLKGVEIRGTGMPDFTCDRIDVIPDPAGIAKGILALRMINMNRPRLSLPATMPPLSFLLSLTAENPLLPYVFRNISIHDGLIIKSRPPLPPTTGGLRNDRSFERIEEINLTLPLLSNTRAEADNGNHEWLAPTFSAIIDATPVKFKGASAILTDGIEARLSLHLPHLDLKKYLSYLPMLPGTTIVGGMADLDFETVFRVRQGHDDSLSLEGGGRVKNLILKGPGSRINIPKLRFKGHFAPLASSYNFTEIVIDRPSATLSREKINALITRPDPPPIRIGTLLINQGRISVSGNHPVSLSGIDFSLISYPGHGKNPAPFAATGTLNDHATVRIAGDIPAAGGINARLECQGLDLATIAPATPQGLSLKHGHARTISATINSGGSELGLKITGATINDLEVVSRAGSTLFFPSLTINDDGQIPGPGKIDLGNITAPGFFLTVSAAEKADEFNPTGRFSFHNLDLTGGQVKIDNRQYPGNWRDARIEVNAPGDTAASLVNISGESGGGTIHLSGRLKNLLSARGELDCRIKGLPLTMFTAVNKKLFPRLPREGLLSAVGTISLSPPAFKGKAEISDIMVGDANASNFLVINSLKLADFTLKTSPASLWIKNGAAVGATLRIRESEGKKSGSRPWRIRNNNGHATVRIDRLSLAESRLLIEDNSPDPPLTVALNVDHGEISNLGRMTAIDLTGKTEITAGALSGIGGTTNLRLTGIRNQTEDEFNISFDLKGIDLVPLSPYLSSLAAFTLRNGKGDWRGKISLRRGQMVADTRMTLRDIATIAGPDCRFDLEFARALLMAPDGRIVIDFPFSANISRGGFSLYPIIGKKIRSLLLRSSVVPFSLLSNANGSIPDEFIRFAAMDESLSPPGEKNLNLIATVLTRRPALGLELSGNGPLVEIPVETRRQPQEQKTATIDLGRERALRVMQFLHDRGINNSRLRLKQADADIDEEVLDRPVNRVDLNLFALKDSAGVKEIDLRREPRPRPGSKTTDLIPENF